MLTKEYEILKPFVEKPWAKLTFNDVKKSSKKKSASYVYDSLKNFVKADVLKEERAGNVILYSLLLTNLKSQIYVGITAEHIGLNSKQLPYDDLNKLAAKIPTDFYILLITGSYAQNKQKNNSDIDVVIICEDCFEPKKIYASLRHDCEMNIPAIHLYVFRKTEFMEMLLNDKANYGKEIAKNSLIIVGGREYFKIMGDAIKNGFNG